MITPLKFLLAFSILIISVLIILINGYRITSFFFTIDQFRVLDSRDVCEQPLNNRCIRHYTVLGSSNNKTDFVPFGGEFSSYYLPDNFEFSKKNIGFSYTSDGKLTTWPELGYSFCSLIFGMILLSLWFSFGGISIIQKWLGL